MSKIIIHIGMPMSDTASIQKMLFKKGKFSDFTYADLGVLNHGGKLCSYFSTDSYEWAGHQTAGRSPSQVKAFNEAVGEEIQKVKFQGGRQIISGEALYHMDEPGLTRMSDSFCEAFDQVEVIGYVCPPVFFMTSAFIQLVKNHDEKNINLYKLWPNYRRKLEKFDKVFGCDNVTLRTFQSENLVDGDVIQDLCHYLGEQVKPSEICRVNESLSLEATAVLFAYNRNGPSYQNYKGKATDNNRLVTLLAEFGEQKFSIAESLVEPVIEKNLDDLKWIETRIGASLRDSGSKDELAIASEQKLLEIANNSSDALSEFVKQRSEKIEPSPQQIANWVEKLRVVTTGRASNGVRPMPPQKSNFFTPEQVNTLTSEKMGPAAALRELAFAFEQHGQISEARTCIQAALTLRPDSVGLQKLDVWLKSKKTLLSRRMLLKI